LRQLNLVLFLEQKTLYRGFKLLEKTFLKRVFKSTNLILS